MAIETKNKGLFAKVFEPTTDFYELLNEQAEKTVEGLQALNDWVASDSSERCQTVRDREKEADELKLQLGRELFEAFVTPFDREDIYDLSARLDEVINGAKAIVREMETFEVVPKQHPVIRDMVAILVEGTVCLRKSFAALQHQQQEASDQAVLARKSENKLAKVYRIAIQDLLKLDDIKEIMRVKEVYKTVLQVGERIDNVGEKLLHAIVKMG
jgi:uncharacterized protein Yka (UPF0111/DUF47 family)